MNAARESRLAGNQTAEVLAGRRDTSILPRPAQHTPKLVGASVETELEATLWRLMDGSIAIWQLTPALAAWWHVAYAAGAQSLGDHLDQAQADADRYYELAMNPGKSLSEMKQRRIDEAIADADRAGALVTERDVARTIFAAVQVKGRAQ
ncbi:hypothetical protein ITJ57_08340 [Plantibacter sp. VKM Ac-2880]|uniref:hypothetical protein n=1 Tax=Plantibacter sp. VKM Ac-2880 TaxID=2783827 RepID=UPI00188F9180|nr:hypothetical protein [Plantibacter sp. VKM Ac-2880]MBF4568779.1 hypothetical protein [Plantibacter sp. VKM Ac-2880]